MFVGYSTLQDLLDEIAAGDLIYLSLTNNTTSGSFPRWECVLMLSAPVFKDQAEIVRYCALQMGSSFTTNDETRKKLNHRGFSAQEAVQQLLQERGLRWSAARVSFPKDLVLMYGDHAPLQYDKADDCFRLTALTKEQLH